MTKTLLMAIVVFAGFSFTIITKGKGHHPKETISQTTGKELFLLNCANCHHATRDVTGPSIYNVRTRWKSQSLLYQYVRNSQEVIKKDPYAKALYKKWNNTVMTPFPKLTNKNIDDIFDYVDGEAKKKGLM